MICNKCKLPKIKSDFRIKTDKRDGRVYINQPCKSCENEEQKKRYQKIKKSISFKNKNKCRAKIWRINNCEKEKEKSKKYRDRPGGKEKRKGYDKKNKGRISALSRLRNKKYLKDQIQKISDNYALRLLRTGLYHHGLPSKGVIFSKGQIQQMKLNVIIKRLNKLINEKRDRRSTQPAVQSA